MEYRFAHNYLEQPPFFTTPSTGEEAEIARLQGWVLGPLGEQLEPSGLGACSVEKGH